jgi:hypothetical protein
VGGFGTALVFAFGNGRGFWVGFGGKSQAVPRFRIFRVTGLEKIFGNGLSGLVGEVWRS